MLPGERQQLVIIDPLRLAIHAVRNDLEILAGEVQRMAVAQVPAAGEIHRQHRIAGRQDGAEDRHVRLGSGVRLHVHVLGAEQLLRPLDGQLLRRIDVLAPAVPTGIRIALGVLVRQHGALRLQHGEAGKVLAGDQLDILVLALDLLPDDLIDVRIRVT